MLPQCRLAFGITMEKLEASLPFSLFSSVVDLVIHVAAQITLSLVNPVALLRWRRLGVVDHSPWVILHALSVFILNTSGKFS